MIRLYASIKVLAFLLAMSLVSGVAYGQSYPARAVRIIVPVAWYHGDAVGLQLGEEWHFNRQTLVSGARLESVPYRDHPRWDPDRVERTVLELFAKGGLTTEDLLQPRRVHVDPVGGGGAHVHAKVQAARLDIGPADLDRPLDHRAQLDPAPTEFDLPSLDPRNVE